MTINLIRKRNFRLRSRLFHSTDLPSPGLRHRRLQQSISVSDSSFFRQTSVTQKASKASLSDSSRKLNISAQAYQQFKMQSLQNSHTVKSNSSATRAQNVNSQMIINNWNVLSRNSDNKLNSWHWEHRNIHNRSLIRRENVVLSGLLQLLMNYTLELGRFPLIQVRIPIAAIRTRNRMKYSGNSISRFPWRRCFLAFVP